MKADWQLLARVPAAFGSTARSAVGWFLVEHQGRAPDWDWVDIGAGEFMVDGEMTRYRVRLDATENEWIFETLRVKGNQRG